MGDQHGRRVLYCYTPEVVRSAASVLLSDFIHILQSSFSLNSDLHCILSLDQMTFCCCSSMSTAKYREHCHFMHAWAAKCSSISEKAPFLGLLKFRLFPLHAKSTSSAAPIALFGHFKLSHCGSFSSLHRSPYAALSFKTMTRFTECGKFRTQI